jgi:hypothetical protein
MKSDLEEKFARVVDATGGLLVPLGFKRRRQSFRRAVGPNVAVVDFQRSNANEASRLRFTVNVAVLSAVVAAANGSNVDKLGASDGHLRERIGSLLGKGDLWWNIEPDTNLETLCDEVASAVRDCAVPYLDDHADDDALRRLWQSGQSPGLTEVQRVRYLTGLGG